MSLDSRYSILDEGQKNLNMPNCIIEYRASSIEHRGAHGARPRLRVKKGYDHWPYAMSREPCAHTFCPQPYALNCLQLSAIALILPKQIAPCDPIRFRICLFFTTKLATRNPQQMISIEDQVTSIEQPATSMRRRKYACIILWGSTGSNRFHAPDNH